MELSPVFIGIDVSKARLDVAIRPSGQTESVSNDTAGIEALVKRLSESRPALIVLEATGGVERSVTRALASAELPVVVVNPRQSETLPKPPVSWPRPIVSMLRYWPASPKPSARHCARCLTRSAGSCAQGLPADDKSPR